MLSVFFIFAFNVVAATECSDGIDNDSDGKIDYHNDKNCWGDLDSFEESKPSVTNPMPIDGPVCTDGLTQKHI